MNKAAHVAAEALSAYCDGEVDAAEAERIEAHLESCEKCSLTLEELSHIRQLVHLLGRQPAPERFAGRVVRRVRRRTRGRFFHGRWQATAPYVAVAVIIALVAALYLFSRIAFREHPAESPGLDRDAGGTDAGTDEGAEGSD